MSDIYTAPAAAKAACVTLRQIQHWTDLGLISPLDVNGAPNKGSGNIRLYSSETVAIATWMGLLTNVSLADAAEVARLFVAGHPEVPLGDLIVRVADRADGASA